MLERHDPTSSKAWGQLVRCRAHLCKGGWRCGRTTCNVCLSTSWPSMQSEQWQPVIVVSKGVTVFQPSPPPLICLLHPDTVGLRNRSAE